MNILEIDKELEKLEVELSMLKQFDSPTILEAKIRNLERQNELLRKKNKLNLVPSRTSKN